MIGTVAMVLGLSAIAGGTSDSRAWTPAAFLGWFEEARAGTLVIPRPVAREARRFRYVFVGGFASERLPGYFKRNMKTLRAHAVPKRAIYAVFPTSRGTIEENAEEFRDRLREIAAEGPERLVIVAHSRGACDALLFALGEPDFVRERVEAIFLVQGTFGGSALADYVLGDGPEMDRALPTRFRVVAFVLGRLERVLFHRGKHAGLSGLSREGSRRFWKQMLAEHAASIPVVGPKTFYLQSESGPRHLGLFRRAAGWYLSTYVGPNDGVVAVEDQALQGLGTCLGVIDCGHDEIVRKPRPGRSHHRLREALAESILMAVGTKGRVEVAR
jgi:pimeloyl-ACP methyl ester carboxylesterase